MLVTLGSVTCFLIGAALGEARIGVLPVSVAGDPILAQTLTTALVAEIRQNAPATEVFEALQLLAGSPVLWAW
jgi:hypothetical protein